MSQNNQVVQNGFVGGYVKDMVNVLAASLITKQNVVLIGAPGYGKTRIALSFAHQTVGAAATSVTRLHPAAPPDVFMGAIDPVAFTQGIIRRVVAGTPYDPSCKLALIDEFSRANEATFDAMLDVADRLDTDDAPPVIATANFPPTGERTLALRDRFALWFWVNPGPMDAAALSSHRLASYSGGRATPSVDVSHLPTPAQLEDIWTASPGPNAIKAVTDFVEALEREARSPRKDANNKVTRPPFMANPRRVAQWTDMLFRLGMWYSDMNPDFNTVPAAAARMLIYAWPAQDSDEATQWAMVALSIADTVAAAIDKAMSQVLAVMEEVQKTDARSRGTVIMKAVGIMSSAENTLRSLAGNDKRVDENVAKMKRWLSQASAGEALE